MSDPVATSAVVAESTASLPSGSWRSRVAAKKAQNKAAIPSAWLIPPSVMAAAPFSRSADLTKTNIVLECGILSASELEITEKYNARELLQNMATGNMTSSAVTLAFSKRAAVAQQLLSCLTETLFDEAQDRAAFLDAYLKREGRVLGPLHGLPISVKDSFDIAGVQSTLGYVSFLDHPTPSTNAALCDILLELGAVLYVKTNIPQTLMTADSENILFGRTLNPRNVALTAGGSSGGEGSLIAFRGSILGVGTDIAGSIRIPALCCGVYGFKPSTDRVPYGGQTSPALHGSPGIIPAAGPLATTLGDIELFIKAVIGAKPWVRDASAHAVPWRELSLSSSPSIKPILTIGIFPEDPLLPWHPPVRRALDGAVAALAAAGHTLVPLNNSPITSTSSAWTQALEFFSLDPSNTAIQHILDGGEPMITTVAQAHAHTQSMGPPRQASILDLAAMNVDRAKYQNAWGKSWSENQLDVLIGPGAQHTATKLDTYGLPGYTVIWNLLDYPACIIPYSATSKELDPDATGYPITAPDPPYDPVAFDGAPCAIQVVAPRFHDEECLRAARIIDEVLKG
ncbi:hypothetical protein BP5796_07037 [Coleophoma crateriformis]|uniref:amidase n=1 Tax=Coleophoma crateriformis TaxID=565419 RepID=A0A3D8RHR7_9HELO|nr:hypothetical protein BP5796_07037 [Coleophoma crateriformis]